MATMKRYISLKNVAVEAEERQFNNVGYYIGLTAGKNKKYLAN